MSYCRFENTYRDLLDCYENMNNINSESEKNYMRRLVDVCKEIIDEYELNKMSEGNIRDLINLKLSDKMAADLLEEIMEAVWVHPLEVQRIKIDYIYEHR